MNTKITAAALTILTLFVFYYGISVAPGLFLIGFVIGFVIILLIDMYKYFTVLVKKIKNEESTKPTDSQ